MSNLEALGEVVSTDLLIIGGGIGGLTAAISAMEESPEIDVLLVDKQTIGWSGKAPKTGGVLMVIGPEDDLEDFFEYQIRNIGEYLNDQDLLHALAKESYGLVEKLDTWGVKVARDAEGKPQTTKGFGPKWSIVGIDLNILIPLRKKARKMGAKMLNKIQVVDLLTQNRRVVGAVGFNIIDGRFYIFKAKSTLLANGSCNYKVERMWSAANGDGIAAAYRAGAEMRNAEFGNFYDILIKDQDSPAVGSQAFIYNANGDQLVKLYGAENEPDIALATILGMEKEINEGKGPLVIDIAGWQGRFASRPRWERPHWDAFYGRSRKKMSKYGPPPVDKPEVTFSFHAELSPVKVDHNMKTTLEGLWAIGDTSYGGSALAGAVFAPPARMRGTGLLNAVFSAMRGGPSAARSIPEASPQEVDYAEVKKLKDEIFTHMEHNKGLTPADAVQTIQQIIVPIKYNLRRRKERMEEALSKLDALKQKLPDLFAKDGHALFQCHEAKAMALCAEMTYRSALMREESRGWHYREDFPERDDKNWLKWIIVKQEGGKMVLSTEQVPIDKYRIQP
jgi:succinate dehydrogenase/fumarate reductase flavoprotein subunit